MKFANTAYKKNVKESLPFDKNTLAFKLHNKIFALIRLEKDPLHITLINPNKALELRENTHKYYLDIMLTKNIGTLLYWKTFH